MVTQPKKLFDTSHSPHWFHTLFPGKKQFGSFISKKSNNNEGSGVMTKKVHFAEGLRIFTDDAPDDSDNIITNKLQDAIAETEGRLHQMLEAVSKNQTTVYKKPNCSRK